MVQFLAHGKNDTVAVATVDLTAGQAATGWNMEAGETLSGTPLSDIPLGHKVALVDMAAAAPVIKYNFPIGNCVQAVRKGDHVHTHNLQSARWQS